MSFPDPLAALEAQLAEARADLRLAQEQLSAALDREAGQRAAYHHRFRNMLAIIRSIFARTMSAGGSIEDIADHFNGRLDTVTRYQSSHALERGGSIDFELLVRDELHGFQFGDDPVISLQGDEARLSQDVAQLVALAIHELVTNSIKFGTLSGANGRATLEIGWTVADQQLIFSWAETGVSVLASAPMRQGFGREFIEQGLPYQIGAISSFELRPGGLTCVMKIPLDARPIAMI